MDNIKKDIEELFSMLYSETPSKNMLEYWIRYFTNNDYKKHTEYGGKWLIFCNEKDIDETWLNIKQLQDKNLLGNVSKVSTKLGAMSHNNGFVICVYTYDSNDKEDLMRVRNNLKENGFITPLKYKRDIETIKGIYGSENEFLITQ